MLIAGLVTWLLVIGTRESATVNAILVVIKVLALTLFIILALPVMKMENFEPFAPLGFGGIGAYVGGGTHLPDIVLAEPIFVDGRITAWTVNLAHHAHFAARGHAHISQEGLRLPPIRQYRAGHLQRD